MEKIIRFGPAGNSISFAKQGHKASVEAPEWLYHLGLNAFEYQCGRGVLVGEKTAKKIGEQAKKYDIALSIHAPYYMNLSNPDKERRRKTVDYVLQSCCAARAMGAERIVIHSGSLMKRSREEALEIAIESLTQVLNACDEHGFGDITLCPELMGCTNQLGTLDEVLKLCQIDQRLIPCIDFGHYNARNFGVLKNKEDYEEIFDRMEEMLGYDRTQYFHAHFSKIEYNNKSGEIRHLTFEDTQFGPDFSPMAELIVERGYQPTIICESAGTQAEDALFMKMQYLAANGKE